MDLRSVWRQALTSSWCSYYTMHWRGHKTVSVSGKNACLKIKGIREDNTAKTKSTQLELGYTAAVIQIFVHLLFGELHALNFGLKQVHSFLR